MHVSIDAKPDGGLRILPALDFYSLGRLEGYNGIGKSAAIRLLRVCVGDQPYLPQEQHLWTSFKRYVGRCTVTMTGLSDGGTIRWRLNPDLWPESSGGPLETIGTIEKDGRAIELDEVRRLVRVERVVGNEGLIPTIVRQLQPIRTSIDQLFGVDSDVRAKLDSVDGLLGSLESTLATALQPDLTQLATQAHESERTARAASQRHAESQAFADSLKNCQSLSRRLQDLRNNSGNLDLEIDELSNKLAAADERLKELDLEVAAAGTRESVAPTALHELELAQRNAARAERNFDSQRAAAGAAARTLGIEDVASVNVAALKKQTAEAIAAVDRELRVTFTAPRVAGVATQLLGILGEAESAGLGDELVEVDMEAHLSVSLRTLRAGISNTAASLGEIQPPERAREMQAQIADMARRLRNLDALDSEVAELRRRTRLAATGRERLAAARSAVSKLSGAQLGELVAEREALVESIRSHSDLRAQAVRARQELGGGMTESELQRRLDDQLRAVNVEFDRLDGTAVAAAERTAAQAQDLAVAEAQASDLQRTLAEGRASVAKILAEIGSRSEFDWARESVPELQQESMPPELAQASLGMLSQQVHDARARADRASKAPAQASATLQSLSTYIADPGQEPTSLSGGERHALGEVRDWFGLRVSSWFQQPQILSTLFVGATEVDVDLSNMTVNWVVDGNRLSRPITAFSSGEQAFAYTRAQLELLDAHAPVPDQIVALDEFGAFISREWLYRLESYLQDRLRHSPADRLLLILPLTRTEKELRTSGASAAEVSGIETVGYYVTQLSASR